MPLKSILTSLAIAPGVFLFASPALANCSYFNYWLTSNGQCLDLTYIGYVPPAQGTFIDDVRQTQVVDLRIQGGIVSGTVRNISNRPIRITRLRYQLIHMGSPVLSDTFDVDAVIEPGQTLSITDQVPASQVARIRSLPGVRVRMLDYLDITQSARGD